MNLFQNSYNATSFFFDSARFPAALKSVSTVGVVTSLRREINTPKPDVTKEPKVMVLWCDPFEPGAWMGNNPQYELFHIIVS